jgi:hypothetical protein
MKRRILAAMALATVMATSITWAGLKITVSTSDPGSGGWGAEHDIVMWIQSSAGTFIKTFGRWGGDYGGADLPVWITKKTVNTVDGTTGATLTTYGSVNATWNLTNTSGARVANGTYLYCIELSNQHNNSRYVAGRINIDSTDETKNGTDSSVNSGSTYLTSVVAEYTVPSSQIAFPSISNVKQSATPFEFIVPHDFSLSTAVVKLYAQNGALIWYNAYSAVPNRKLAFSRKDINHAHGFSGVGLLVADFNTRHVSYPIVLSK